MNNSQIIGRKAEQARLKTLLNSQQAEFLAVYGRRRIGKTFLIREYFSSAPCHFFMATGQYKASITQQLWHFRQQLSSTFYDNQPLPELTHWNQAFTLLADAIEHHLEIQPNKKIIIFLDELPWMSTPRSGVLAALDLVWNTRLSPLKNVVLIVCGSAASWMITHLIQAKGGLHNRITAKLQLKPYLLDEVIDFLSYKGIRWPLAHYIELYMAIGGVPYYLNQIDKGLSIDQAIAKLCFSQDGLLREEYDRLFASLFHESEIYDQLVKAIALQRQGLRRQQIIEKISLSNGGRLSARLEELSQAGFIQKTHAKLGGSSRNDRWQLIDPFIIFRMQWMNKTPSDLDDSEALAYWHSLKRKPTYRPWSGLTFELFCFYHRKSIKIALGIDTLHAEFLSWTNVASARKSKHDPTTASEKGAQIDMIINRDDGVVMLCEIKYNEEPFVITKNYLEQLKRKQSAFERVKPKGKAVQWMMISKSGVKENEYYHSIIDRQITIDDIITLNNRH